MTDVHSLTLEQLSAIHGSDKITQGYIWYYDLLFRPLKDQEVAVLEIGIGGHNVPNTGGESLRLWRDYFPNGQIYGLDIQDKEFMDEERITTFCCSQVDTEALDEVVAITGPLDIVIDDGSHFNEHQLGSYRHLFRHVKPGGFYVIEDVDSAYHRAFGGDPTLQSQTSVVEHFRNSVHYVNSRGIQDEYLDKAAMENEIEAIIFGHAIIILRKALGPKVLANNNFIATAMLEWDEYQARTHKTKDGYFDLLNSQK
ncbi:hypothetical protein CU669_17945 [Paramagnetospirillum kuznetsovii]|uniref:Class I SAM-dependent methyltransferase n=1 Tax=Paramagnetospirillum kuznetsovii TaxID=2053833 RepID=A0A364NTY0_9PROT|nr:class I SAM-dependent methyltransferase [Paramagnetospirillum kuznetsovii]RAU20526.1 hypothetical protein CU669_17945 [Paramagnetospirillum kuznetsovii]